jgi:hypothetical protein
VEAQAQVLDAASGSGIAFGGEASSLCETISISTVPQGAVSSPAVQIPETLPNKSSRRSQLVSEIPLILYAYSKSEAARVNIEFFIRHGLHAAAEFVFILNGETDVAAVIPKEPNIRVVQRENDCYDIGAYAEVLTKDELYKGYNALLCSTQAFAVPLFLIGRKDAGVICIWGGLQRKLR